MRKLFLLIAALLLMGFVTGLAYADRGGRHGSGGGGHAWVQQWNHPRGGYFYSYQAPYYRYYPDDGAFRVYPYSYYYGYAYPRYVQPPRYYYYRPNSGIYFYWSW